MPKQLLALAGAETMIVTTAARTGDARLFHPPLVVTGGAHADIIREQLGNSATLIVEPMARNTAPAIALALLAVERSDPDGIILVMPSDHQVTAPGVLMAAVGAAAGVARDGWLVTFGIHAATPETGYGYIREGEEIGAGARAVRTFIEKPDLARATALVADGGYSWNSGIFLFSAPAMRAALQAHAPAVLAAAEAAMAGNAGAGRIDPDAAAFAAAPSISIDHAVFEHAAKVAVCPIDPGWSDIGSWDALHELGPHDAHGNVVSGRVESLDTGNCLLRADGVVLTTVGVDNLNIIATPDAVLVTARGRSQSVRDVAARLAGDPVLARPVIQQRRWGEERIVHDGSGVTVRKLALADGSNLETDAGCRVMLIDGRARANDLPMVVGALVEGALVGGGGVITGEAGAVLLILG